MILVRFVKSVPRFKLLLRGAAPPASLREAECLLLHIPCSPSLHVHSTFPLQVSRSQLPAVTGLNGRKQGQEHGAWYLPIWRIRLLRIQRPTGVRGGADWLQKGRAGGPTSNPGPQGGVTEGTGPRSQPDPYSRPPDSDTSCPSGTCCRGSLHHILASRRANKGLNRATSPSALASFKYLLLKGPVSKKHGLPGPCRLLRCLAFGQSWASVLRAQFLQGSRCLAPGSPQGSL